MQHTFVAAGRWALLPHIALLACRRVPLALASGGADGADLLLLERGRFLARAGYAEFLIATRDHIFAPFAARHRTTVITPTPAGLSPELRRAAHRVELLPCA